MRSKRQTLWGVQIPLALPNIMQGVNQCTMMSLAMVVIASMIGTRGIGDEVLLGLQQLKCRNGNRSWYCNCFTSNYIRSELHNLMVKKFKKEHNQKRK